MRGARRSRAGALVLAAGIVCLQSLARSVTFTAPFRAAVAATAVLGGSVSDATIADVYGGLGTSSIQTAELPVTAGGTVEGGLEGTFTRKKEFKNKLLLEDEKAIKEEERFEEKFDSYLGVFAILFIGAFIAPMVTYLWYVRDEDPWKN
mmetsp:Transcript_8355/g.18735  ORF Transcript_8355/g.18735 Transcript_8355/m.18735 type:complete len:149 (-) Transcript_8355:207-653(-)|eukprot:CAMPEP_0178402694 /NCGR_PEP_ID=MMETSP0689_2-20121128/16978_1 /TAXON_ID=160604 /ORGANISM="Amphidinium massartii, Strain CS-259" /LENGTH=148 /DNA_ID=CAMNT_0020023611 /DNA_START=40 /DNA_END=486 /DNA_ORIENTATION=-